MEKINLMKTITKRINRMLNLVIFLNAFDCLLTLTGYLRGFIIELNPINSYLLEKSPLTFITFKYFVGLFLFIIYRYSGNKAIKVKYYGSILLMTILTVIFFLHIHWIFVIFP